MVSRLPDIWSHLSLLLLWISLARVSRVNASKTLQCRAGTSLGLLILMMGTNLIIYLILFPLHALHPLNTAGGNFFRWASTISNGDPVAEERIECTIISEAKRMSLSPQRPEPAAFNCIPDYYLAIVGQTNCSIFGQKKTC